MCTDEPPTPDECPLAYDVVEYEMDMATPVGSATGSEPLWDGTNMQYSSTQFFECAPFVDNPEFKVYVPEDQQEVKISAHGRWNFVRSLGSTAFGVPMGEYAAPPGEHYSSEPFGRYVATGGVIRAVCYTVRVRTGLGVAVYTGANRYFDYTGNISRRGNQQSGSGSGRGWAFSFTGDQYRNGDGDGEDWDAVLDKWLSGGGCTDGWEIWVDDDQKCDAHGNEV